jgi:hypothetical protein
MTENAHGHGSIVGGTSFALRKVQGTAKEETNVNLDEFKKKALAAGKTKIRLDEVGARPVDLAMWRGVSTNATHGTAAGMPAVGMRQVVYEMQGNKALVKRAGDKELKYELS